MSTSNLISSVKTFPKEFWILNLVQMLEKLAYWSVLLQMPIYTSQKDVADGLHWEQYIKGIIFFVWAMVQNISPLFLGGVADKYGRRKMLVIAVLLIAFSYSILATQRDFYIFIAGVLILGFGSGMFKPAVQGAISSVLKKENSSTGWGIYFMLMNFSIIAAPPLSKYLREMSWSLVFWGSAVIILLNLIFILALKGHTYDLSERETIDYKRVFRDLRQTSIYIFILCMSGFAIIYMQFYETLPNFIYDWSDTSSIAKNFSLPRFMLMDSPRGLMISYEWLYNINTILVTLFVVLFAWLTGFIDKIKAIIIGVTLSIAGLGLTSFSIDGSYLILGIIIYSFGELITNPKFNDYLSSISPKGFESSYMSYLNLSMAIGLGGGSLLGGFFYGRIAEKSSLALDYLHKSNISYSGNSPFIYLSEKLGLTPAQTTELLWKNSDANMIWMPFLGIGVLSIIGLIYFRKKYGSS